MSSTRTRSRHGSRGSRSAPRRNIRRFPTDKELNEAGWARLSMINEFASAQESRRLNTSQKDQLEFMQKAMLPPIEVRSDGLYEGLSRKEITKLNSKGMSNWRNEMAGVRMKRPGPEDNGDLPEEVTRRMQYKHYDGKPVVMDRPIRAGVTTQDILTMKEYPAIRIALAARMAYVQRAFRQYSIQSTDPMAQAIGRAQAELIVNQSIASGLMSMIWGFQPCELVFERRDLKLRIREDERTDGTVGLATSDPAADPAAPPPLVRAARPPKMRDITLPDSVVITKCKELAPPATELYVAGDLQEFDGLRYMQDDKQRVSALASYVVTHDGAYGQMYGRSLLAGVKKLWYEAVAVGMFTMYYLERKGDPPAKAFAPPVAGYDENDQVIPGARYVAEQWNKLRSTGLVAFPSVFQDSERMYDLELLQDDQRADMFRSYQEHLIKQIFWGILMPDGSISQSARVGSFAASQTYADVAMNLREIDLGDQEGYFNKYLLQKTIDMNMASKPETRVRAMLRPDVRQDLLKEIIIAAMGVKPEDWAGNVVLGLPDWDEVYAQVNIPQVIN